VTPFKRPRVQQASSGSDAENDGPSLHYDARSTVDRQPQGTEYKSALQRHRGSRLSLLGYLRLAMEDWMKASPASARNTMKIFLQRIVAIPKGTNFASSTPVVCHMFLGMGFGQNCQGALSR
jgi:hypothetical protein